MQTGAALAGGRAVFDDCQMQSSAYLEPQLFV